MNTTKYWIAVVSKDHAQRGVAGGFMQACHGKQAPLKRMRQNDGVIFYSPKQSMQGSEPCQAFTAIGRVINETVYQHEMSPDFIPFRRNIEFYPCQDALIRPLLQDLDFIADKRSWGYVFRFGFLQIPETDFRRISECLTGKALPWEHA